MNDDAVKSQIESLRGELSDVRRDVSNKHSQNRQSIHELRGTMQGVVDQQHDLEIRLAPFLGTDDTPGIIPEMAANVKTIMTKQVERVGIDKQVASNWKWFRWIVMALLAALLALFAYLSWRKADHEGWLRSTNQSELAHEVEQSAVPYIPR